MTTYAALTTCSDADYEKFGRRMEESWTEHWPVPLHVFRDKDLLAISPDLVAFREWATKVPMVNGRHWAVDQTGIPGTVYDFRYDAVKFAWKTFALIDGMRQIDAEVVFWADADTVTHAPASQAFVDSLLPDDCYTACLQRKRMHPECGFVAYRKTHPMHDAFMSLWRRFMVNGEFLLIGEWHDSFVYWNVCQVFEQMADAGHIGFKVHNLTPPDAMTTMHPFVNSPLGSVMDHLKGSRKNMERTPDADLTQPRPEPYWNA